MELTAPATTPARAIVRRVDFGTVQLTADGHQPFTAIARGAFMGAKKSLGNAVVVGDEVHLAWDAERAMIERIEPRRNSFSRRAAGERVEEQVVAANLDQVVLVTSLRQPEFKHGLVDRVLAQAAVSGIHAVLVINKTDLGEEREALDFIAEYAPAHVTGYALCAKSGRGVDALLEGCRGKRSLFVGHSGVGKSTLLGKIAPGLELLAGEVNRRTGKGRHTTTAAALLEPEPGLQLIDTPGVRSFGLWGVDEHALEAFFPEIAPHLGDCRFGDCRHVTEPGCAVRAAMERGEISERRWESFRHLREELGETR